MQVAYQLELDPQQLELRVQLHISGLTPRETTLLAPALAQGDYDFEQFCRAVADVHAFDPATDRGIEMQRHGWSCYTVQQRSDKLAIAYRLSALPMGAGGGLAGKERGIGRIAPAGCYLRLAPHSGPCRVLYSVPRGWAVRHPAGALALGKNYWEYTNYEQLLAAAVSFAEERHVQLAHAAG
jgi:predicted metalloprotease with PDZ domain